MKKEVKIMGKPINYFTPERYAVIYWNDWKATKGNFTGNLAPCYPVFANYIDANYRKEKAQFYAKELASFKVKHGDIFIPPTNNTIIFRTQHRLVKLLFTDLLGQNKTIYDI